MPVNSPIIDKSYLRLWVIKKLEEIALRIKSNMDKAGVNASGRTKESVKVVEIPNGGRIVARQYFQGLEIGRPAGRTPYNFVEIIKQWILDKGLSVPPNVPYKTNRPHKYPQNERSLYTMASAIAYSIKRRGYDPWRNGGRVKPPTDDIYSQAIQEGVEEINYDMDLDMRRWVSSLYNQYTGKRNTIEL